MRVRVADGLLKQLRRCSKAERKVIGAAMNAVLAAWGRPHLHSAAGIRRLSRTVFECRIGLEPADPEAGGDSSMGGAECACHVGFPLSINGTHRIASRR